MPFLIKPLALFVNEMYIQMNPKTKTPNKKIYFGRKGLRTFDRCSPVDEIEFLNACSLHFQTKFNARHLIF